MKRILLILIIGIAFFACDNTHTHEWGEWQHNETEHWKECTANDGAEYGRANHTGDPCTICGYEMPKPVQKTYIITLKDGALVFTVEYKALPTDAEPAYLTYLKERLGVVVNSEQGSSVSAVNNLLSKGNSFTIKVEYDGASYDGMVWSIAKQAFTVHNDWISTASGTDLSASIIRDAFNLIEIE